MQEGFLHREINPEEEKALKLGKVLPWLRRGAVDLCHHLLFRNKPVLCTRGDTGKNLPRAADRDLQTRKGHKKARG